MFPKLIALAGVATVGKDTFYKTLARVRPGAIRISIADTIRSDCHQWILEQTGIDCNTCTPAEKELIRPILVGFANAKRYKTSGRYFIDKMDKVMDGYTLKAGEYFVLTDARFNEYAYDEPQWIKKHGGVLVHIMQYAIGDFHSADGAHNFGERLYKLPANDTEKVNDPKVWAAADYRVAWEKLNSEAHFEAHVNKFLDWLDAQPNSFSE